MRINRIALNGFRNYDFETADFHGLFTVAFAVYKLDRRAAVQLNEAADVDQRENAAEVQEHVFDGGKRYVQRIIRRAAEHVQKYHFREL